MSNVKYVFIRVCPATNRQLDEKQYAYAEGVCIHCGDVSGGTFTHEKKIVGHWVAAKGWRRLLGQPPIFVPLQRKNPNEQR